METNINKPTFLEKVQKYTSPTEISKEFNTKLNNFKKNLSAIVTETRKYTLWELIVICWNDLFAKRSLFGWLYLIILSAIPAVFEFTKSGPIDTLGLWTSITGIVCVILVTEGRASNYFFGLINAVVYLIMALQSGFYGEVITTLYFLISQPIGLYLWWGSGGNLQIVVMYLVYTINSIYGWYKWNQSAKAATAKA